MSFKEKRELRVYKRMIRRYGRHTSYVVVPEIRLQGKWLEDYGFNISDNLLVECKEGKLIIRKKDEIANDY